MSNYPMRDIYESIRHLDKQVEKVHQNLDHCIGLAIQYLDCSEDSDRTMPDVASALEMLREAEKELRG
jgi:hypothetical protein